MADPKKIVEKLKARREDGARPAVSADEVIPSTPPAVRKGESALTSRPFSMLKAIGAMCNKVSPEKAKVENDLLIKFRKALDETGNLIQSGDHGSMWYPGSRSFLATEVATHAATQELVASGNAGASVADPEELLWVAKNYAPQYMKTAMSYLTDTIGGSLVAPPEMGEIIPLMRNKSVLDRAGAKQVPLPANGKWVAPRITGASTGTWIGENTEIPESNPTTGEVTMMAKKNAVLIRVPNELFKFASAASDALFRDDIAKTLALNFDYAGLYGAGSGGQPKGVVNFTGTNELIDFAGVTPAPKGIGTNGNQLRPEDGYRMAGLIAGRNFDPSGFKWVLRPELAANINGYRADAVTTGDGAGTFVQAITRLIGANQSKDWCGYELTASAQVRQNQSKGSSGTVLTDLFGGVWSEFLMGMYGAVEFATATQGDVPFARDQTMIRGILHCDCVPRYPGAFIWYKQLLIN